MSMREEVTNWFKQGEADFRSAQNSKKSFDFYMSVIWQQAFLRSCTTRISRPVILRLRNRW